VSEDLAELLSADILVKKLRLRRLRLKKREGIVRLTMKNGMLVGAQLVGNVNSAGLISSYILKELSTKYIDYLDIIHSGKLHLKQSFIRLNKNVVGKIFRTALEDVEIPKFYEVCAKESPSLDEIPEIKNPSINGLIEIGRGCCRGCQFCSVTLRPLRWYSYEKIERELLVNVYSGIKSAILHAEDVLLYGSKNVLPDREKVVKLHMLCKRYVEVLSWSHTSMAAVAAAPQLVEEVAELILNGKQEWWGAEIGIETGSPELAKKVMPAKTRPFSPEQWPEVVKTAAGIMTNNNLVPACTLITGLPQETEDDVIKTIELMDDLKDFKSLIVPLFFVPLGRLKDKDWFTMEQMNDLQMELLIKCLRHDIYWAKEIMKSYFKGKWYSRILSFLYWLFVKIVERKAKNVYNIPIQLKTHRIEAKT